MTEWFQQTEFASDEGGLTPNEHFERSHSPTLGYTYIEKSLASLEAGLEDFEGQQRLEAKVYANVSVFREAMQYMEEFGIYLLSRLDPETEFIEAITGTTPKQVRRIFESIRDGEFADKVADYQDNITVDEWLKRLLGYDTLESQGDEIDLDEFSVDQEITVDTVDEAISSSLESVKSQLQDIAEFFLRFKDPYNAIKHGTRVIPLIDHEITIDGPGGPVEVEIDEEYVSFICKTSGDRRGGYRYIFTVPDEILREQAVSIVQSVKNLYSQMYEIRQRMAKSARTGGEVTLKPNLYGVTGSSNEEPQHSIKSIENPDATIWIPQDAVSEDLDQYELPHQNEVAVGIYRHGNNMVVKTAGDQKRSYKYPILIEAEMKSDKDNLMGMMMRQEFSFTIHQLPLWQYLEFLSLSELGLIENVTLEHEPSGESSTEYSDDPISIPKLPQPNFPKELEYMRNVGRAADKEVWVPYYWPSRVLQVIQFYREEYDLTRDVAEKVLEDIALLTADEVATLPVVAILDAENTDEDGIYPTIDEQRLDLFAGGVILEVDGEASEGNFSIVEGADPRYDRSDIRDMDAVGVTLLKETPREAYDVMMEQGILGATKLSPTADIENANSLFETKRQYGPKYTWYYMDKFYFIFYENIPPHHEDTLI